MKKILVTGGAGFIGSHIVDTLIRKNYNVIIVDNLSKGKKEYINKKSIFYKADIIKNISYIFKKEKPDIVIHLSAQVQLRESLEEPLFDAKSNILGTINILEECRKNNVKKIIYTSTGGARVGEPEYLPVDEKHSLAPCSPYGISKHTAEHYVWMYNQLYNLDYLIFCFGNVYGPRDDPNNKRLISIFINNMIKGKELIIFGDGKQTRDFIYVTDIAEFIVESINKNSKHKLFHLANGKQVSVNKIVDNLKKLSDFNGNVKHISAIKGEVRDIVLDTSLAKKELSWKPKHTLQQGLKKTIKYFKNEK